MAGCKSFGGAGKGRRWRRRWRSLTRRSGSLVLNVRPGVRGTVVMGWAWTAGILPLIATATAAADVGHCCSCSGACRAYGKFRWSCRCVTCSHVFLFLARTYVSLSVPAAYLSPDQGLARRGEAGASWRSTCYLPRWMSSRMHARPVDIDTTSSQDMPLDRGRRHNLLETLTST